MSTPKDFPQGYRAVRWLGEGSVGDVWLAEHIASGGHCAVKVLDLTADQRGSAERSFNREVRAMARLNHPSLVDVYDFGRTPSGCAFVAMECVIGAHLGAYLNEEWPWARLWTLIDCLLSGLAHAHARDIVHRDLKPSNILIVSGVEGLGAVKIVDFGIAMATTEAEKAAKRIEGTPAYIAPEAAQGRVAEVGPWTDIYSLGVIFYELLTGRLPFYGRNLLSHHQHSPVPELRIRAQVEAPDALISIVRRMMEKLPAARYRSVAELREDLRALAAPRLVAFEPIARDDEDDSALTDGSLSDSPLSAAFDEELSGAPLAPMNMSVGMGLFHLRLPPLVGRADAQQVLEEAAQRVLEGRGPQVVLVEAEAGLGKSRLVDWLRARVEEWGLMQTLTVRSEPQTRGGGLRQAVLRAIGAPGATVDQAEEVLARSFPTPEAFANAQEALWPSSAEDDLESRFKHAAQLIVDLAGGRPLMFWADDAHWSPEGRVLRLLHALATRAGQPLLLVATLRPTERRTVRNIRRALMGLGATLLQLRPIPEQVLSASLSALVSLPEGLVEIACEQSRGNPLIAVEAVRGYLSDQGLAHAPMDPSEVLRQRIDRACEGPLGGELKSLLARSTLLGRSFTPHTLAKLALIPGDPHAPLLTDDEDLIESLLDRATQAGLIKEQRQRWVYAHDLIRVELKEIAEGLPNWRELNLATAELRLPRAERDHMGIEMEMVARNYWEGGERAEALRRGQESLWRLMKSGLMGNATSLAKRLLSWDDELHALNAQERCALALAGGEAATLAGHHAEAEQYIEQAISEARAADLYEVGARGVAQMGLCMLQGDHLERAGRYFQEAQRFLSNCRSPETLSVVRYGLGLWALARGEVSVGEEHLEESLAMAQLDESLLAQQLTARLALAKLTRVQGRVEQAQRAFQRIFSEAIDANLEVCSLEARLGLGLCAWRKGDTEEALPYFAEVRKLSRGNLSSIEFYAAIGEAWAHTLQNDWDQAQVALMQAEGLCLDVPRREPELEELRLAIKTYAQHCKRLDLISQVQKLSGVSWDAGTTYQHDA
jgi:serine/threonine protein kinase/tetratricopeptide (TPR) repeat protein